MDWLSRRELLLLGLAASAGLVRAEDAGSVDIHRRLLELAAHLKGNAGAVSPRSTRAGLERPEVAPGDVSRVSVASPKRAVPPSPRRARSRMRITWSRSSCSRAFPAISCRHCCTGRKESQALPGVLSPCGHSAVGKAARNTDPAHQPGEAGLRRPHLDPVGQGERSQFWDAEKKRTRFNLGCGEHAVLGNALYLLGTSLARYRIWDEIRAIDYLAAQPEVDASTVGCVGNSGGGTLTAYITALDPRAGGGIGCYITTLPRRMGNRIQTDPGADPEQDISGFVSEGIDHAGLLALLSLRGRRSWRRRSSTSSRRRRPRVVRRGEAALRGRRTATALQWSRPPKHGLWLPLREAIYGLFGRWLAGPTPGRRQGDCRAAPARHGAARLCRRPGRRDVPVRPLLPLALAEFHGRPRPPRQPLRDLLRLEPDGAKIHLTEIEAAAGAGKTLVLCVNGNEAPDWREQTDFLLALIRPAMPWRWSTREARARFAWALRSRGIATPTRSRAWRRTSPQCVPRGPDVAWPRRGRCFGCGTVARC